MFDIERILADNEQMIIEQVQPFTTVPFERILSLIRAVEYIAQNKLPGDLVECGIGQGGTAMAMALILQRLQEDRTLWLYDTYAGVEHAQQNMLTTGYQNVRYIKGKIEDTLHEHPAAIALLRLDTDFYEPTRREMETLYPLVVQHGVLIIDDYGQFSGVKTAIDEYFSTLEFRPLLQRVDYAGRLAIKP